VLRPLRNAGNKKSRRGQPPWGVRPRRLTRQRASPAWGGAPYLVIRPHHWKGRDPLRRDLPTASNYILLSGKGNRAVFLFLVGRHVGGRDRLEPHPALGPAPEPACRNRRSCPSSWGRSSGRSTASPASIHLPFLTRRGIIHMWSCRKETGGQLCLELSDD